MRVLLVRHAHAGVRGTWPGDDLTRELSDLGIEQADALADCWADAGAGVVLSSRATRCVDTVRPLAERLGLPVQHRDQLLEGTAPKTTLAWLETLVDNESLDGRASVVACSHGDVIGGVVERLADRGTPLEGELDWPKGSTWELEVDDGLVVRARLHPTPPTPATPDSPPTPDA